MRDLGKRWRRAATLGSILMGLAWSGLAAQEAVDRSELEAAIEERFEVRPLRSGLLLEPRDEGDGPRSIEVGPEGVALDGTLVADDELEARLGGRTARLLRAAAALPAEELRDLFLEADAAAAAEPGPGAEGDEADVADDADVVDEDALAGEEEDEEREQRDEEATERRVHRDAQVVFGDSLVVEENEISDDVVVIGGSLDVLGEVRGDAVVVGGSLDVDGEVDGDAVAVGGSLTLGDGARVGGDVVAAGGSIERGDNVEIGGKLVETPFGPKLALGPWLEGMKDRDEVEFRPWERWMKVGWKFFWVVFLSLLACLALLIARRPVERMEGRIEREPWKSGLVGLLAQALFLPLLVLVVVVLCVSIIGIPLLLLLPFALLGLFLAGFCGFVAVARRLGIAVERRFGGGGSPYLQAIAGIALIYAGSLVGHLLNTGPFPLRAIAMMILILGTLVWYASWTVGFGAALLTRLGSAESWQRAAAPAPPPTPPPTPPPAPVPPASEPSGPSGAAGWADDEVERS